MKDIGMVIINYNDFETTYRLLDNIKNYQCLKKIVVVDNHSTDDSFKKLKKLANNKISVVQNKDNSGYASGMNLGAKKLMRELKNGCIIFSNSDIIIEKEQDIEWLANDIDKDIKVVAPVIVEHDNYNRGWKKTSVGTEILLNLPLISRYFRRKLLFYDEKHYKDKLSLVDVVSGCFFMVDAAFLKKINYFDDQTFLYYEEAIFSVKVQEDKKKIAIVKIIHDHSVSIDKSINRLKKYNILKESQRYYVKNYLKANSFQLACLWITRQLSLIILKIRLIGKKGNS